MKKILSLILVLTLALFAVCSCDPEPATDDVQIKIGVMNGPTGMGMAKLISDNKGNDQKYDFSLYSSPTDATAALANGELDMLCVPTNLAANLANKQSDYITVAAINCLGSLYLLTDGSVEINSIEDLAGKTITYGEPTSTTGPIIKYLLSKNDIEAEFAVENTNEIVSSKMVSGEASIVILPEPKATAAINAAKKNGKDYSISLNLSTEWSKVSGEDTPLTMGCIIVSNTFVAEHSSALDSFLEEYKSSIEYIGNSDNHEAAAQMIVDAGVLPQLPVAKSALTNLYGSIVYMDGADMENALKAFYAAIGLTSPSDNFFYD